MATSPRREVDQSGPGGRRRGHCPPPPRPLGTAVTGPVHRRRSQATRATGRAGDRPLGWFAPPGGKPRAIFWHGARTV